MGSDVFDANFDNAPVFAPTGGGWPYITGHVNTPTPSWYRGALKRRLPRILLGGTEAMRIAAGSGGMVLYAPSNVQNPQEVGSIRTMPSILPKEKGETDEEYQNRRDKSVLSSFFEDALEEHVGRAFHMPPQLLDDVPVEIRGRMTHQEEMVDDAANPGQKKLVSKSSVDVRGIWENIDLQGNSGDVFGRRIWMDAEADGDTYVLVEMQPGPTDESGAPIAESVADRAASGRRPYWVHVTAQEIIEGTPRICSGRPRLSVCRIRERRQREDGWIAHRVRKFIDGVDQTERNDPSRPDYLAPDDPRRLARWELYEQLPPEAVKGGEDSLATPWPMIDGGRLSLTFIPLVPFQFGRKLEWWQHEPPLARLAEMNLVHYRVFSDYLELVHTAGVPLFHRAGWSPDEANPEDPQLELSSKRLFWSRNPSAKMEYVEHNGHAIGAIRQVLLDLEERMQSLSLEPLLQRLGTPTATAEGLKAAKANARIEAWMVCYKDALEHCLDYTAQLFGKTPGNGGSVSTNKDLGLLLLGGVDFNLIMALNAAGKVDDRTLLLEAKRRGILHFDADIDEILATVKAQQPTLRGNPLHLQLKGLPPKSGPDGTLTQPPPATQPTGDVAPIAE